MIRHTASSSTVPKAAFRSSRLANTPFDTFAKTVVVCTTSLMSFSLHSSSKRDRQMAAGFHILIPCGPASVYGFT